MVRGLNSFKEWFRGYETNYAIIGGTACDLLMDAAAPSSLGAPFTAFHSF